ncbi:MAG: hypothetical protein J5880_01280 [Bacilli bacterium]|nr:hypothetical protein [Bacilli bacterium]
MKKSKALLISTVLAALSLTSCGKESYYGTYQFQMGKKTDAHIGIYMDLTGDNIEVELDGEKTNMEKFNLKLSIPDQTTPEENASLVGGLLTFFEDGLFGGYKIQYIQEKDENHLTLVPVIDLNKLMEFVAEKTGEEVSSSSEESSSQEEFVIPSDFIDDVLIATYKGEKIDVTVPVSLNDLMFQLYWYGFDIFDPTEEYPLEKHEKGTHPTEEDIKKINETFNSDERLLKHYDLDALVKYKAALVPAPVLEYRDFNQLTMTLSRAEL